MLKARVLPYYKNKFCQERAKAKITKKKLSQTSKPQTRSPKAPKDTNQDFLCWSCVFSSSYHKRRRMWFKYQSWPHWPSLVWTKVSLAPKDVQAKRPKNKPNAVLIKFFADNSFQWCTNPSKLVAWNSSKAVKFAKNKEIVNEDMITVYPLCLYPFHSLVLIISRVNVTVMICICSI